MKIPFAENLKKLRRAKDMTQDDLAQFLGVTFQAVSKWERNEGYPDITMLPVIANYFEVTVDSLLGNDIISKEERIEQYRNEYWWLNKHSTMDEAAAIAKKAYAEYPYEWGIIEIYILSLTRGFSQLPDGETLIELRRLCDFVMEKCPDSIVRKRAVYSMIFAEDDEHVERWFKEAPDNFDYLESERREGRYIAREQWELFFPLKQQNTLDILEDLSEKMGIYHEPCTHEWQIDSRKRRIELWNILFRGTDRALLGTRFSGLYLELAMAYDKAGKTEEAITALTEVINCLENHRKYGESLNAAPDEKVNLTDPMWDRLQFPAYPPTRAIELRTKWFDRYAEKPEYAENETFCRLHERVKKLNQAE